MLGRETHIGAHFPGHELIVAGHDLYRDAVLLQRANSCCGTVLRRIEERQISIEDQVLFVIARVGRGLGLHVLRCYRQHAKPVPTELLVLLAELIDADVLHRQQHSIEFEVLTSREDRLGGALTDDSILSLGRADDNRHNPPLKIERDLVDLAVIGHVWVMVCSSRVLEDSPVQHALQTRLEVAVKVRQRQYALVRLQDHVAVCAQDHSIHRERARFVRAEHIHRPQVLDGIDSLDDDLLLGHRHGAFRETHGDDHR